MYNLLKLIIILLVTAAFAQIPDAIGRIMVQGESNPLELRLIDTLAAREAGNGLLMMALPEGMIAAADLVDTLDIDASSVFVNTIYGIRAWRKGFLSEYIRIIRGPGDDYGTSVAQLSDGGIVYAGVSESYGAGGKDIIAMKLNHSGESDWAKAIGSSGNDGYTASRQFGCIVEQTNDNGLIVGSCTFGFDADARDIVIIKLDSDGEHLWSLKYGGEDREELRGIIQMPDSSYYAVGWTWSFPIDDEMIILTKISKHGTHLWSRSIGSGSRNLGQAIAAADDGGLYISGWTTGSYGNIAEACILMKTSSAGSVEWARMIGGSDYDTSFVDNAFGVASSPDGGALVSGFSNHYGGTSGEVGVFAKFTETGLFEYARTISYGLTASDTLRSFSILPEEDGSILILSKLNNTLGSCLLKLSPLLDPEWSWNIENVEIGRVCSFKKTDDNGYAIAGFTDAYYLTRDDFVAIKFSEDGMTCSGESMVPIVSSVDIAVTEISPESNVISPDIVIISPTVSDIEPNILYYCP